MPRTTATIEQAAHRRRALLDVVALRALLADLLAEAERMEQPDVRRHEDDDEREGEQQALDQLDGHRGGAAPPSSARSAVRRRARARRRARP